MGAEPALAITARLESAKGAALTSKPIRNCLGPRSVLRVFLSRLLKKSFGTGSLTVAAR
jgi:hypothetical protein